MKKILLSLCFIINFLNAQNSLSDINGNTYEFLNYGTQAWTVENAVNESYRDGTPIPQVTDQQQWSNLTTGAWCYFSNNPAKGKLYNWYAIMGIHDDDPNTPNKEFAPNGWHVPTDTDWNILEEYLIANGYNYDGSTTGNKIAKSLASISGWAFSGSPGNTNIGSPGNNQISNNSSGFNALPVGNRSDGGAFGVQDIWSIYWIYNQDISKSRWVYYSSTNFGINTQPQRTGLSVRFVKDTDGCSEPAPPIGYEEQIFCAPPTVAGLSATGDNIKWYDAPIEGNLLDSTIALTDGQVVYASQTINDCESTDRLEVTVFLQDITITASATEVCVGASVQITTDPLISGFSNWATGEPNNLALGTEHYGLFLSTGRWNDGPDSYTSANCIVESETNLGVVNNFTFMGIFGNHHYYLYNGFDGWNNCNNLAVSLGGYLAIINSQLETNFIVSNLPSSYDRGWIGMYQDTNHPDYSEPGGAWFWVDGTAVTMTSNPVNYNWSTGDTTETISVTPIETMEYWVDVTTNGITCREYVTITVNDLPEAPTGENINYFIYCDSFNPTLDDVIATLTGDNIKLYDAAAGGNLLDLSSNILDGQLVYASQTLDSCESSDRLEVQLNLYTLDTPVTDAPNSTVSYCNEQNLTILDLAPAQTATDRLWYETETSTIPVLETTLLIDGATYYVSNYDIETGCESDRLAMTVEINNPEAPTADAVQSFCDNVNVSDLLATGSNIQWYDASTGGNILDPGSALSDGQVLYATQAQNGCESITRLEVNVEIDIIPDPILITTELEFCLAREATLADLEIDDQGFTLELYDSFSGGNMLPMDTLLEDGVSYYATLYDALSGCESLMRLEVVPTVIPCEVIIYNALSLNDNGQNDYMVIENAEYFPDNNLEVYNRDGHLVYSQTQYGLDDNLFRGIANVGNIYGNGTVYSASSPNLPTGSYLYIFKYFNPYEQQQYTLKGFLTINSN